VSDNNKKEKSTLDNTSVAKPDSKTEHAKSPEKKIPHKKTTKKSLSTSKIAGGFLAALMLISIAGGYYLWEFINDTKNNIDQRISNTKSDVTSLSDSVIQSDSNLHDEIKSLVTLQNELSNSVQALLSRSTHMRKDWLVSEAEYLVKLAANRLTLEGDIKTAITALTNADARLLDAGDPGLLLLRQELTNKISTLKTINVIDINGISIKISSVIKQIDKLPLVTPDPESIKQIHKKEKDDQEAKNKNDNNEEFDLGKVITQVTKDLTELIRIRKHDQQIQPLLTPEQRFYLTQNLKLQLEQARTALLHHQENTFKERITVSITWINEFFDKSKKSTQSVIETLSDLGKTTLTQETPDLSYALKMFTHFQAGIRLDKKQPAKKKLPPLKLKSVKIKSNKPTPIEVIKKSNDKQSIKEDTKKVTPILPIKPDAASGDSL